MRQANVRAVGAALFLAGLITGHVKGQQGQPADAESGESRLEIRFIQGLRELGYHDLAQEYTAKLEADTATPPDLKTFLEYESGRGLVEQATNTVDLENRQKILEQARQRLDAFAQAHANHPLVPDALLQLARLHVERGHTAALQASDVKLTDEKGNPIAGAQRQRDAKLLSARASFAEARKAYDAAEVPLKAKYDTFSRFYPEGDPRREARDRAHAALMDCQLQRAVVDFEDAKTHAAGSAERTTLLDEATKRFADLHRRYRTQLAGLHARMLQAKCLEERGELGQAMGIYDELMDHTDPWLRGLQRKVGYYRIIVMGKRREHALGVDEANRWLQANPNHHRTEEGLGVQLELARNILAQIGGLEADARAQAERAAVDRLSAVVPYYSPHKAEALELLERHKPRAAERLNQASSLGFDAAMAQADTAIASQDWGLAEALLKQAIRQAERTGEFEKVNRARYFLAYVYYAWDRYYESAVIADHLARRYPEGGLSAKAAEIGLASLTQAYNTFTQVDRLSDIERMTDLARYIAETWPESEEADNARLTLGEVGLGRGDYADAAKWLEAIGESSPKRLDAQIKAGDAHWRQAQRLRDEGKTAEADAEANLALECVAGALRGHDEAGTPRTEPARIATVNALAEIHRASGRAAEAIALLEPIAVSLQGSSPSADVAALYAGSFSILLRSYLAAGQADKAIGVMKVLETINPSKAALTRLYYELGQALEAELAALEKKNDAAAHMRTQEAFKQFLLTLAASEAGQSYDSLQWAGESLLGLNMPKEAGEVLGRVLEMATKDPSVLGQQGAQNKLLRTRLKLVAAAREEGRFEDAREQVEKLVLDNPRMLDPLLEKGMVIEAQAAAENSKIHWEESLRYWKDLATRLQQSPQRRVEAFEAWYHAAIAMQGLGQKADAAGMLRGIMTLTPSVGSSEMKAKYEDLLRKLGS